MEMTVLDGARMTAPQQTHEYIAQALRFPVYYGGNLDALADCLGELSCRTVVLLINAAAARAQLGDYAAKLFGVFEEASAGGVFRWIIYGG